MRKARKTKSSRPFVLVNMAMTADGKIATANRAVHSFGSRRDLKHLYELRATADAVMCGARTVEATGTVLGNGGEKFRRQRLKNGLAEFPVRVIVSGSGSINPRAAILKKRFSPIIVVTNGGISNARRRRLREVADEVKICGRREVNFRAVLQWLRTKWGIRRLLCEGGGELAGALFRAGVLDELHLTICPKIFGGRDAPTIADGRGFRRLADAGRFRPTSIKRSDGELFVVLTHLI